MVFSTKTIEDSNLRKIPALETGYVSEYSSYLEESLNMIVQESEEFNKLMLQEGLLGDLVVKAAKGALQLINPEEILGKIFDWFVSCLERLGGSFRAFLLNFVNDSAELAMFKKKLANFRGQVRYTKEYFVYKNMDLDTSRTTYQIEVESQYNELVNSLQELSTCRDNTSVEEFINQLSEKDQYDISDMDDLRGRVTGTYGRVTKDEFADKVFNYYRTSETPYQYKAKMFEKNIDGVRVHQAYTAYFTAKDQERIINRDIMKLKMACAKEKAKVRTLNPTNFLPEGLKMNPRAVFAYNSIVKTKILRIKDICEIYTILFSGKLDALKEYNKVNRDILLLACKEIAKG